MQDILDHFEKALNEQDLVAVRMSVDHLLRLYVPKTAPLDLRKAIYGLLLRKAAESSNRVLTNYLRTVADCLQEYGPRSASECAEKTFQSPITTPRHNRLGFFLHDTRGNQPQK